MSELKASDLTAERFNQLTPTQAELLALLSEEGGEVVQIVGKILRHGLSSCHPDGGLPNYRLLESEIGDLIAATRLIASAGMIDMVRVEDAADEKLRRVFKYLHHSIAQPEPEREECPDCFEAIPCGCDEVDWEPAPSAAPVAGELAEAVERAISRLLKPGSPLEQNLAATYLETWARSQATAQPVAVGMTEELERVLEFAAICADQEGGYTEPLAMADIATVRQQAAQVKP